MAGTALGVGGFPFLQQVEAAALEQQLQAVGGKRGKQPAGGVAVIPVQAGAIDRHREDQLAVFFQDVAQGKGRVEDLSLGQMHQDGGAEDTVKLAAEGLAEGRKGGVGKPAGYNRHGGYLGAMADSAGDAPGPDSPPESDRATAERHGRRIALAALRWRRGAA